MKKLWNRILKAVKTRWNRVPKAAKLALDLLLILGLLYGAWAMLGYPMPTRGTAFRMAQKNAMLPAYYADELLVNGGRLNSSENWDVRPYLLGTSGDTACRALIYRETIGWKATKARSFPAVDGVFLIPLPYSFYFDDHQSLSKYGPALAVKLPGAASLDISLELDEGRSFLYPPDEEPIREYGGTYPMLVEPAENGWFLARFDPNIETELIEVDPELYDAAVNNYCEWISDFLTEFREYEYSKDPSRCVRFLLTAYDESGAVIKTLAWEP